MLRGIFLDSSCYNDNYSPWYQNYVQDDAFYYHHEKIDSEEYE